MTERGPAIVLMYHRVASDPHDPSWLQVRRDRFEAQLEALRASGRVVPLDELRSTRGPRLSITFDDGYADNARVARPLLEAAGLPATFFVSSCVVEQGPEFRFWWDRLQHLLLDHEGEIGAPLLELAPGLRADIRSPAARERALELAGRHLRRLPPARIDHELARLAAAIGVEPTTCACHPVMTADEVRELAASPGLAVGGHTRSHALLAAQGAEEQLEEVRGGKRRLEEVVGAPLTSFAYPFGDHEAFDHRSVRAVRRAGFARACTTIPRPVTATTGRYRIPRIAVRDWPAGELAARLERWFAGLGASR